MIIQQGDVLLKKIDKLPSGKKLVKNKNGYVLAKGEVTGHAHIAKSLVEEDIELIEKDGVLYIGAKGGAIITHEEHKHVALPPGNYEVGIVKEYDHFKEEARKVYD